MVCVCVITDGSLSLSYFSPSIPQEWQHQASSSGYSVVSIEHMQDYYLLMYVIKVKRVTA